MSKRDLCHDIRSYLVLKRKIDSRELQPKAFYEDHQPCPSQKSSSFYAGGDDGDLQEGVAWPNPPFSDNGDGTVTDNLTGLIRLQDANCFGQRTWPDGLSACNSLAAESCGLNDGSVAGDWRLPNVRELNSLIHYGFSEPALPDTAGTAQWTAGNPFFKVLSEWYWSSTTVVISTDLAWLVRFKTGIVSWGNKGNDELAYVWCVRGGQ